MEPIRDVVDASGTGGYVGSRDTVGGHIHWMRAGDGSPVGGVALRPVFEVYSRERGYGGEGEGVLWCLQEAP